MENDPLITPESNWSNGFHFTSKGQTVALSDMPDIQLQNTIAKYSDLGFDTTLLENELANRNLQ